MTSHVLAISRLWHWVSSLGQRLALPPESHEYDFDYHDEDCTNPHDCNCADRYF